ncbi:MAG: CoA transferase, partial [Hyphomicrobiales bacterium]|nr:CoA transferase [Hyphomicrobiales bacterium]
SGNDGQYRKLCAAIGGEELAAHPDYATNRGRVEKRATLVPLISALTAKIPKAEMLARLEAAGVPAGPINNIGEVFADPQVNHRRVRVNLENPQAEAGFVPSVRSAILLDGEPQVSPRHAPGLGQHRAEILADPNWNSRRQG